MKKLINENLEKYVPFLTEKRNCIVCNSKKTKKWARYGSFNAVQCDTCGLIWINPFLNTEGLQRYYTDYIGMRFKDKKKTQQRAVQYKIDKNFIEQFISKGKVLDVGCSGGFFLDVLSASFEKHGSEIDGAACAYAREKYPFGNNINHCALEDLAYNASFFDLIVMRGVIEHLPDPRTALKKVSQLLKPNGFFYIAATPNVDSFCAQVYREKWNQFHPVRHLFYFSLATLTQLLSQYGLMLVAKDFPYLETPYADIEKDHYEMLRAFKARKEGDFAMIGRSRAFWGNMMNVVFQKKTDKKQ